MDVASRRRYSTAIETGSLQVVDLHKAEETYSGTAFRMELTLFLRIVSNID